MTKYKVGDRVIYIENNQVGIVTEVYEPERGQQYYQVTWIGTGDQDDYIESRLEPERKLDNPFELVGSGIFRPFYEFSRLNTQYKIENTSVNTISSLKASRTIFKPYQYKPLLKFLNSESRRLLIADEVGLGKTIEAGHIMLELKARKELSSALVICPNSLVHKWHDELQYRFDFDFKIYETKAEFISDIENHRPLFGIITYEKARESGKNDIGSALEENDITVDFLVCDEAHKVRNDGTITHRGVNKIISSARSAIFMTATPIMLNEGNLFHLLQLLDPFKFMSESVFMNLQNINKPFVAAVSQLNAKLPFKEIAENLKGAEIRYEYKENGEYVWERVPVTVKDEYKDVPLFARIMNDLETLEETDANRVRIQHDINSISVLSNIFSRTTKREITTDWSQAERRPHTITVSLTPSEQQIYDDYMVSNCGINLDENPLAVSTHKKIMASSVIANGTQWELYKDFPTDTKYNALKDVLNEMVKINKKKVIIFATQIRTLNYLAERLEKDGMHSRMIHGQIKERHKIIDEFKASSSINILLSSEVGGEGLDLQFCDTMVNYDLPWNPMVVEQRIGRIDRFGQKSKTVNIYNILVEGTLAEKIYNRLLARIGIFRECIGDIEVILDRFLEKVNTKKSFDSYLESELDASGLTEEEYARKIDSISKALEQEKQDVEHLTKGLTDSLTNDMYFKEEIRKIRNQSRYVTEHEILAFVQSILDCELKTCRLKEIEKDHWQLIALKSDSSALTSFLTKYQPVNVDRNYFRYINSIREENVFDMTFNQEYAFEHKECEYINIYHPIVQAIKEYYKQNTTNQPNTYKLKVSIDNVPESVEPGKYLLGVYLLDIEREIFKSRKHSPILVPVIYDCENGRFIDESDDADKLFSAIQEHSEPYDGFQSIETSKSLQLSYSDKVTTIQDKYLEDYRLRSESNKIILLQRTEAQYKREIARLEDRLWEFKYSTDPKKQSMVKPTQGLIDSKRKEMESELEALKGSSIIANPYKLVSLSVVSVE